MKITKVESGFYSPTGCKIRDFHQSMTGGFRWKSSVKNHLVMPRVYDRWFLTKQDIKSSKNEN